MTISREREKDRYTERERYIVWKNERYSYLTLIVFKLFKKSTGLSNETKHTKNIELLPSIKHSNILFNMTNNGYYRIYVDVMTGEKLFSI